MFDLWLTVLSCCEVWAVTLGPNDLIYIPGGMSFAEKVGLGSGDVFGIRIPLVAASQEGNDNVMKKLFDAHADDTPDRQRLDAVMKLAKTKIAAVARVVVE